MITVMMPEPQREFTLIPQDIPLDILFEDDQLMVVNKPAGMVVHPAFGNYTGTMVNALLHHMGEEMRKNSQVSPYLVHRIDKDTSGLILVAKNEQAQSKLQKQFYYHTIRRQYVALVWGDVKDDEGTIDGNIGRNKNDRKVFRVYQEEGIGKHAVTNYKVLERFGYVTMIRCELETGRTHQIRVHMKHLGHPLFNDATYGGDRILRGTTFSKYQQFVMNCFKLCPRQALHARSLGFDHPVTNEHLEFSAELPDEMRLLIEKWRNYAIHKASEIE
jgi:23S rRNA pseudouridine1911/1915/1917 synthase